VSPLRLLIALGLLLGGCAAQHPRPAREFSEGERLYRANCASCHALRNPQSHTDEEWIGYVEKYSAKLNLNDGTRGKILAHLQASN